MFQEMMPMSSSGGDTFPNPLTVLADVGVSGSIYASTTIKFSAGIFKKIKVIGSSGISGSIYLCIDDVQEAISQNVEYSVESAERYFTLACARSTGSGHGDMTIELYH